MHRDSQTEGERGLSGFAVRVALAATLQREATSLQEQLQSYQWGKWLIDEVGAIDWRSRRIDVLGKMKDLLRDEA